MTIRRITISVHQETAGRIKKAAGRTPVSSWVTGLIEERLEDAELEQKWREFYDAVSPTKRDLKRAETMHRRMAKPRRRGAA